MIISPSASSALASEHQKQENHGRYSFLLASVGSFFKSLVFQEEESPQEETNAQQSKQQQNTPTLPSEEEQAEEQSQRKNMEETISSIQAKYDSLQRELNSIKSSGLSVNSNTANAPTQTIERVVSGISKENLDSEISSLKKQLENINTNLLNQISVLSAQSSSQTSAVYKTISLTNKIDNLSNVTISNATVSGMTGLTDSDIPDTITASNYLPLSGGTMTGNILMPASAYLNFGSSSGTDGYGFRDNGGTLQIKNSAGSWSNIPTSGTTQWTTSGSDIYYTTGNIGVGTTSPYWKLSVAGMGSFDDSVRASYFTATSTTATSTFPYLSVTTNSNVGTVVGGTWQGTAIGDGYLTKSGDWTGTLDTYEASSLLARSNHTGTQGVSTLSNYDWTFSNNYGAINLTGSSTKPIWAQGGLNASSTSNFVYASTTALTVSGNSYLGTVSSGIWNGTAIGDAYIDDTITLTNLTQVTNRAITDTTGTLTVARGGTGQTSFSQGWLHSDGTTLTASTSPTIAWLTATSTTATSTFAWGIQANALNITSTSATSTFARGLDLAGGCFAINGTCVGGSSGSVNSGTTGQIAYYAGNGTSLTATSSLHITTNQNVGIGSTTPFDILSVERNHNAPTNVTVRNTVAGADVYTQFQAFNDLGYNAALGLRSSLSTDYGVLSSSTVYVYGNSESGVGIMADHTNGVIKFGTGDEGPERMRINSVGNVGIGTTSPYSVLSISNSVNTSANTPLLTIASTTAGTATSTLFTILASGNVGIGTNAPTNPLHVYSSNASGMLFERNSANNSTIQYKNTTGSMYAGVSALANFGIGNAADLASAYLTIVRTSGNVGIGTTTPNSKLTVYNGSADSAIEFSSASGDTYKWTMGMDYSDAGKFKIASSTALGTIDRFVIDGRGYVGIGTSSPSSLLSLKGSSGAQISIAQADTNYTEFTVDASGNLTITPSGSIITIPDDNLKICSGGACQTTVLNSGNGNLTVENNIEIGGNYNRTCPSGYIWVPGSAKFGTLPGFCVMKYEAKNDGSGNVSVNPTHSPYVSIDQPTSRSKCEALGLGYHLISEPERMTIAENIAQTPINDMDDDAGLQLATGHSDNAPASALAATSGSDPVVSGCNLNVSMENVANAYSASSCEIQGDGSYAGDDADKGFYGTSQAWATTGYSAGTANKSQLRTHILSNGNVIWDIAGNVWDWTDAYVNGTAEKPTAVTDAWQEWSAITNYLGLNYARPQNPSWSSSNGIGKYYAGTTAGQRGFVRGGDWNSGAIGGVFTLNLNDAPSTANSAVGFRCVR